MMDWANTIQPLFSKLMIWKLSQQDLGMSMTAVLWLEQDVTYFQLESIISSSVDHVLISIFLYEICTNDRIKLKATAYINILVKLNSTRNHMIEVYENPMVTIWGRYVSVDAKCRFFSEK